MIGLVRDQLDDADHDLIRSEPGHMSAVNGTCSHDTHEVPSSCTGRTKIIHAHAPFMRTQGCSVYMDLNIPAGGDIGSV